MTITEMRLLEQLKYAFEILSDNFDDADTRYADMKETIEMAERGEIPKCVNTAFTSR
jgi:hypothetical protein